MSKIKRRSLLAALCLTLLSGTAALPAILPGIVFGQRRTSSTPPGLLSTMTLVNTSGSTQPANFITPIFGMTFKKGDIASGTAPTFKGASSGTIYPYSWGLQSYYSDGSLRHASFMFICKDSISGSGTLTVNVNSGGSAPSASSRTLTEVYAQNLQVGGAGVGSFGGLTGTWNGYLTNDANNLYQYVYMDGQAGKSWRIGTNMATSKGGSAHGQLIVDHYITALQDNSGNLGGFRHMGRITQPYYNHDTPTKALRAFASISTQYGSGPTTINGTWPFSNINFTGTNTSPTFTVASSGTHNLYSGAQPGNGGSYVNCVPGYLSATTDAALSTSQIYFAYTFNAATNNTTFQLSRDNIGFSQVITSSGGTSTFVPIPVCLHGGSIYTADSQGRSNFFQGTGSLSADNTVRTQYDQTYLHSTGAIPPWNLSVNGVTFGGTIKDIPAIVGTSSSSYWTGSPTWNPVSCGPLSQNARGGAGTNLDIGPLPSWHAAHFYNQSAVGDMAIRAIAFASDFDGVGSLRDFSTGNYINVSNTSYTGMPSPSSNQQQTVYVAAYSVGGFTAPSTPPNGNLGFLWGGGQGRDHKPSMAFYAFLVFGEPHFYDLMIEAGTGSELELFPTLRVTTSPSGYGIQMVASGQGLRGSAWGLRDMALAATYGAATSPDGSQIITYLKDLTTANLSWCNSLYSATYLGSALNSQNSWRTTPGDGSGNCDPSCGGFMMSYFECVMAWLTALGYSGALAWTNSYATWLNYVISNYGGYNLYAQYDGAVLLTDSSPAAPISSFSQYGIITEGIYSTVSWTTSSPCFTANSPGFGYVVTAGDKYIFNTDVGTPGGFSNYTAYYARDVSGNSFNLAASPGGSPITPVGSGSASPGSGAAGGEGTPWIIMAAPPNAASGNFPNAAVGANDSYLLYRKMAWDWAVAAGATGYSAAQSDASRRLNVNFPDFTGNAVWYSQASL